MWQKVEGDGGDGHGAAINYPVITKNRKETISPDILLLTVF